MKKFRFIKYLYCVFLVKRHIKFFKVYYQQEYKLTLLNKIELRLFDLLFSIAPDFRFYLKLNKPIITRAYYQRRLSIKGIICERLTRKINLNRYSDYPN